MSESPEARRQRLDKRNDRDAKRRERVRREKHQERVGLLFAPKKQAAFEQTLQQAPQLPHSQWQELFRSMLQAYFGVMYQASRSVAHPVQHETPRQIPLNWPEYFQDVFRDDHVRASSAINFFGICQQKTLLERVEEKRKFFNFGERPRAMRHGSDMHKRLEEAERGLAESYSQEGYPVSFDVESLCGYRGLSFVQEAAFESVFDGSRRVRLSGHPDRVVSRGGAVFVLEAKTNLFRFSPHMVAGACIQDLFYGLLVERYAQRPVVLALTESTQPLERNELDALVRGNDAYFMKALSDSGKVGILAPFSEQHRQLALYFLDQMVSVAYNPRLATGADKKTCDRYECPFRSRGCDKYARQ